jgi:hypothetical protein
MGRVCVVLHVSLLVVVPDPLPEPLLSPVRVFNRQWRPRLERLRDLGTPEGASPGAETRRCF